MKVTLGISTGFTVKRWPDPEDWVKMVKSQLGLDLIQFSFDQFDPRANADLVGTYCQRVKKACLKYDVTLHSTFTGLAIYSHNLLYHPLLEGRLDGLDWFGRAFAMTRDLGAAFTGGPFGGLDVPTFAQEARRRYLEEWAGEAMAHLLKTARHYGIKEFYWEPTPVRREGPVTIAETLQCLERINHLAGEDGARLALCLDTGHATSPLAPPEERDPYLWLEKLGQAAPIIHLQQSDGKLDRHWPFTPEYNARGIIHADRVLDCLEKSGSQEAVLLVEVGHPFEEEDAKVMEEITRSVEYWQEALTRRGI